MQSHSLPSLFAHSYDQHSSEGRVLPFRYGLHKTFVTEHQLLSSMSKQNANSMRLRTEVFIINKFKIKKWLYVVFCKRQIFVTPCFAYVITPLS